MLKSTREVAKATLRQKRTKEEKAKEDRRAYREKAGKIIVNNRYFKITKLVDVRKLLCRFCSNEEEQVFPDTVMTARSTMTSDSGSTDGYLFGNLISREGFVSAMRCIGISSPSEMRALNRLYSSFDLDAADSVEIDDVMSFFFPRTKEAEDS